MITIGQIIQAAWPSVLAIKIKKGEAFADPGLNIAYAIGKIKSIASAAYLEDAYGNVYHFDSLRTPIAWSKHENTVPENAKIHLSKTLIENAIEAHEDSLAKLITPEVKTLYIPDIAKYQMSGPYDIADSNSQYCILSTAFCRIPIDNNEKSIWPLLGLTNDPKNDIVEDKKDGSLNNPN